MPYITLCTLEIYLV